MLEAVESIGTIVVTAFSIVAILGVILYQWAKRPRCSVCGTRVVSRDIGLSTRMTQCPSCGVGKIEPIP